MISVSTVCEALRPSRESTADMISSRSLSSVKSENMPGTSTAQSVRRRRRPPKDITSAEPSTTSDALSLKPAPFLPLALKAWRRLP